MPTIEEIYNRPGAHADFKVVFVDVVSYSERAAHIQQKIVSVLTACLNKALAKTNTAYWGDNSKQPEINFQEGVIIIPTGDGAAIAFTYTEHLDIHLKFAVYLLEEIQKSKRKATSDENKFDVRIGIADDKGIIYKDINGNHNLAGRAINMASRVMDIADGKQIMLTEQAGNILREFDSKFNGKFTLHKNIQIKNAFVDVWQYTDRTVSCLNTKPPTKGSNAMPLTQSDLKDALSPIGKALEQITKNLVNRFHFFNDTKQIYGAVEEAINKAEHNIRIVRLGLRPAVSEEVLDALKRKVSEGITYDIVVVFDPSKSIGGFQDSHRDFKKKLKGNSGAEENYNPYVLETNEPICFDTIIVDNTDVGIGFIHARGVRDLQNAIMFHNPDVAGNLVHWFDNVIKGNPKTEKYDDWERRQSSKPRR